MTLILVGTSRCDVPARESAGGIVAPLNAARTAQRAVPTRFNVRSFVSGNLPFILSFSARGGEGARRAAEGVFPPVHAPMMRKSERRGTLVAADVSRRTGLLSRQ